jgi:hypothetical protein
MRNSIKIAVLFAFMALGITLLPATASAGSPLCPTGECKLVPAQWVPGTTISTSGGAGGGTGTGGGSSTSITRETPVSKLVEVKKSYEKKYNVVVGYYQNPHGYEGNAKCIDPTKVKMWKFHAGTWYKTTNHLREPVPPARWKKGDKICDFKEVKINGKWWVTGTQEVCSNVKSWLPIKKTKIRKPRKEYVQFPTWEKFYEIAIKKLEIKSESQGGSGSGVGEGGSAIVELPGHYTCSEGVLVKNDKCQICPPPLHCEEEQPPVCEYECVPDHKPQISCVYPPHIYVGGSQAMFCEASDSDGDALTLNIIGDSHLQVSSVIPVNERWDGSSCPIGVQCYRATLWGKSAGTARIVATVTANGKEAKSEGSVSTEVDEF